MNEAAFHLCGASAGFDSKETDLILFTECAVRNSHDFDASLCLEDGGAKSRFAGC